MIDISHKIVGTVYKAHHVAHGKGRGVEIARWKPVVPFCGERVFSWDFATTRTSPGTGADPALSVLAALWSHQASPSGCFPGGSTSRPKSQPFEVFNYLPLQMLRIPPSLCPICLCNNLILGRQRPGFIALQGSFCHIWVYVYIKGNKMRRLSGTCFLSISEGCSFGRLPNRGLLLTPSDN